MLRFIQYIARFQAFRSRWDLLPVWGRGVLTILALPGMLAIALSIIALVVSILALLLLTVPVYRALRWLSSDAAESAADLRDGPVIFETVRDVGVEPAPRRHVEVKIIE